MNEGDKSKIDGLMDGKPAQEEVIDWKTKYENLENSMRADYGRNKILADDNRALKEQVSELEGKLARFSESKASEDLMSGLSEDERSGVPEEVLQATAKMVRKAQDDSERRLREMEARRNAEAEADRKSRIERFIEQRFPRFFADVGPGGDKARAWLDFRKYNEDSFRAAMASGDTAALEYHISRFYNDHLGVPVPSGEGGSATPDPRNIGGGSGNGSYASGKTYSQDEFLALYDAVEKARDKGDYAEKARLEAEIKAAPAEGRVRNA